VVDEYQDFNRMEIELIEALAGVSPTLVAGDDDQALYTFRHASAIYLRDLVRDERFANFELPFCSRCPEVLVEATHQVVARAQAKGLLGDRLAKAYVCYLPEKRAASEKYPRITHARCSVERNNTPYIEQYLEQQILAIPAEDIERSRAAGHPTVLVVGPKQFSQRAFEYLRDRFGDVVFKMSSQHDVRLIEGYNRLMKNRDSRLGWRILLHVLEPANWTEMVSQALRDGAELVDAIPEDFRSEQLETVALLERIASAEEMTPDEMSEATKATRLSLGDLLSELGFRTTEVGAEEPLDHSAEPSILVTSLMGAKGLQAEHVFVLGLNGAHFPTTNDAPTEAEVCQLLVVLTRAREHCTLVSVQNFGGEWLGDSVFIEWLEPLLDEMTVNRDYWA
jgi:superfamily I DNA/RNA helicase